MRSSKTWYGALLRLYPKPYYERFGDSMIQTFNDLYREQKATGKNSFRFTLWLFLETLFGIIREHLTYTLMQNKRLIAIFAGTAIILLIPLIAMQFTNEVNWELNDFVIAGALLLGTGLIYELVARNVQITKYRMVIGIALLFTMLLIWADLAVGIFNIPGISGS